MFELYRGGTGAGAVDFDFMRDGIQLQKWNAGIDGEFDRDIVSGARAFAA